MEENTKEKISKKLKVFFSSPSGAARRKVQGENLKAFFSSKEGEVRKKYLSDRQQEIRVPLENYIKIDAKNCWNWVSGPSSVYGMVTIRNKTTLAHRVFYENYKKQISPGMQIDHLCKNTRCVNPDHLEEVSPAENMHRSSRTKLTKNSVLEIRKRYATKTISQTALSVEYGVGQDTISRIINNKRWNTKPIC